MEGRRSRSRRHSVSVEQSNREQRAAHEPRKQNTFVVVTRENEEAGALEPRAPRPHLAMSVEAVSSRIPAGSRVLALSVLFRRAVRQLRDTCPVMDEVYDALRSNAGLRLSFVQRARAVLDKPVPAALAPRPRLEADVAAPLPELYAAPSEELRACIATIAVCLGKRPHHPAYGRWDGVPSVCGPLAPEPTRLPPPHPRRTFAQGRQGV